MPYTVNIGAVAEITLEGKLQGQQVMNVFHYVLDGDPVNPITDGRAAMVTALNAVEAANGLLDAYTLVLSQDVEEITAYGQWITPSRYAYVAGQAGPQIGQIGQASLPANVAATIVRRGDQANRRNISISHIPGVPNNAVQSGEITPAHRNLLDNLLIQMLEEITLGNGRVLRPAAFNKAAPAGSAVLNEGYVNVTSRVMRRRTVGVGA